MHKNVIYSRSANAFNVLFDKNLSKQEVEYLDTILSMLKDAEEQPVVCEAKVDAIANVNTETEAIREAMEELIQKLTVITSSPVILFLGSHVVTDTNDLTIILRRSVEFF